MLNEIGVGFREVFVPEKAVVRRKRRRMRTFENEMLRTVNVRTLLLCVISPQYKDQVFPLIVQFFYRRIGKSLPAFSLM